MHVVRSGKKSGDQTGKIHTDWSGKKFSDSSGRKSYDSNTEFNYVLTLLNKIIGFGNRHIIEADISNLGDELKEMKFYTGTFNYFGSEKFLAIANEVNLKIDSLLEEISLLKSEMGNLLGLLRAEIRTSESDVNGFLETAGFPYKLKLKGTDESDSEALLVEDISNTQGFVDDIRNHLSWGERNAFALVLFMFMAKSQEPDLIILDDPISSFDNNKKYAIVHRLFKSGNVYSFLGKTVLLLTHDFEPVTDLITIKGLSDDYACCSYMYNRDGSLCEDIIDATKDDIVVLSKECIDIASDDSVNIISRVTFLRKYCELAALEGNLKETYELLSSLIHVSEKPKVKKSRDSFDDMDEFSVLRANSVITQYIKDFDYNTLLKNVYDNPVEIFRLYDVESNSYFKLQIFRELCEHPFAEDFSRQLDTEWYKYVDETYHIENDYIHFLDVRRFDVVPFHLCSKVNQMVEKAKSIWRDNH